MLKKKLGIIIWIFTIGILFSENYYVSPSGNNDNSGSIESPFATVQHAHDAAQPGDTLILRGGTYYPTAQTIFTKDGNSDSYFVITSYPGELPAIDGENVPDGDINHGSTPTWTFNNANYWKIMGPLKLTNGRGAGINVDGANLEFELIESCYNGKRASRAAHGFMVWEGTDVLFKNCDAHHNANHLWKNGEEQADNQYQHGDGWRIFNALNIRLEGCRSWHNLDDNYDFLRTANPITLIDSWAAYAGRDDADGSITGTPNRDMPLVDAREVPAIWGNGIKLGYEQDDVSHEVIRCLTWNNNGAGFHMNLGPSYIVNSVSFGNKQFGFDYLDGNQHEIYNSWEFNNNLDSTFTDSVDYPVIIPDLSQHSHNSWDSTLNITVTSEDFITVSDSNMFGDRQADGSLPANFFLNLAEGSDLINAGMDVGLAYIGNAPDLGAYESEYITTLITEKTNSKQPENFNLSSYPNPFNPSATIRYNLLESGHVIVAIYDIMGREVIQLDNSYRNAGSQKLTWNAVDSRGQQIAAGMYILSVRISAYNKTVKMMYIK